jgi:peptidoglycan/xylan/chitin deacetylase (PgdA/CDA1 family)
MSFDDGPHPELTPKLLDMLKERGIKATFYVVGRNVAQYPDVARRIVAEGHEIANHTWSHPSLTKLSAARVAKEIESTTEAITGATGVKPTTLRPPYGATNAALNRRINDEFGLKVAMWSVDPQDWKIRKASHVSSHIIERAVAGDIILAHDIHPSTVAAMPQTLDALAAKGLKFVTVAELMAMDRPMEVARREPQAAAAPTTP